MIAMVFIACLLWSVNNYYQDECARGWERVVWAAGVLSGKEAGAGWRGLDFGAGRFWPIGLPPKIPANFPA